MFLEILWKHTSLKALKFTILLAVLQLLVSYVSSSYVAEIFTDVTIDKVQRAFIAITVKQILHHIFDLVFFLSKFGLEWIAENNLDIQLGENEKSLSPGTIRTIVLAHLMWDLQQYLQTGKSIKFVVLDEVDTAIDFGTVRKFYIECILPLFKKYGVPCIIISHSKEFKDLVRELGGDTCRTLTATKEGNIITYQ